MKLLRIQFIILVGLAIFFVAVTAHAIPAPATVSGTVTHAVDGTPVSGITVSVLNTYTTNTTNLITGSDGSFSFTDAPVTYEITHATSISTEPGIYFLQQSRTVSTASGVTSSGNDFALTRRGRFTGHVYSSDGVTPLSGAVVAIENASGSASGAAETTTASDGSYFITPLPSNVALTAAGTYTFTVQKADYSTTVVSGIALTADEATVTKDLSLTPESTNTNTSLGDTESDDADTPVADGDNSSDTPASTDGGSTNSTNASATLAETGVDATDKIIFLSGALLLLFGIRMLFLLRVHIS